MDIPCAEFLINDPRLGDPTQKHDIPWTVEASITILKPIRNALVEGGFEAGKIRVGSPWGCGFTLREGDRKVAVFFFPNPSVERNRWEGVLKLGVIPSFWRGLLGIKDRPEEIEMVERVAVALKSLLAACPHLAVVRWTSWQRLEAADEEGCRDEAPSD